MNVIDINVGLNKLSECLGKGLDKETNDFHVIPDLFNEDSTNNVNDDEVKEVFELLRSQGSKRFK